MAKKSFSAFSAPLRFAPIPIRISRDSGMVKATASGTPEIEKDFVIGTSDDFESNLTLRSNDVWLMAVKPATSR